MIFSGISRLDFMGHFDKSRPSTLTELKAVVEAFAESVDPEEVKRSARSTWKRARACRAVAGRRTSVICSETVKWDHFL